MSQVTRGLIFLKDTTLDLTMARSIGPSFYLFAGLLASSIATEHMSEYLHLPGHQIEESFYSPLPHEYISKDELPREFVWTNLTRSMNQHLPHYCGSCWAHAAISSLQDRIKIALGNDAGPEINLSIQYVLNCGGQIAGSCNGGSASGTYEFIRQSGYIPFESCQPYIACSSDSEWGFCPQVDTTCKPENICRTCAMKITPSIHPIKTACSRIDYFPNATIAEYGVIRNNPDSVFQIKAEIYARGPVAAGINGKGLHEYDGSIYRDMNADKATTHVVSIVGWKVDEETGEDYWVVRNSWGQAWGLMGYFHILAGHNVAGIENKISWATPGSVTRSNFRCYSDGSNCHGSHFFTDTSKDIATIHRRLQR